MVVIGYKRVRNLKGHSILASSGYKCSVEASVVSDSKVSRRCFVFRGYVVVSIQGPYSPSDNIFSMLHLHMA